MTFVRCCKCRVLWPPGNPGVLYRHGYNSWWCADGQACEARQCVAIPLDLEGP